MILETKQQAEVQSVGTEETIVMGITDNQSKIQFLLSENTYSDPIGSLIRESVSNSLDAHVEAGVTEPIIVSLGPDKTGNWWFKTQDFGTGISPDRMRNVIAKYGETTKDTSANQLGCMGLGAKAPLAYTDMFYFDTNYEGIRYKYLMRKGDEGHEIDLLFSVPTTERNGTTVEVALKNNSYSEKDLFHNKICEQLCYFEGVYFQDSFMNIRNEDITIIKHEDWKYSTLSTDSRLHLCLDNVYYPLDFHKLGIDTINIPIGLNFKVSEGIIPIPNRESIRLTPHIKQLIMGKIKKVADYFANLYNEKVGTEHENFLDFYEAYTGTNEHVEVQNIGFDISSIGKHSHIELEKPKLKGIQVLDLKKTIGIRELEDMFAEYRISARIAYDKFTTKDTDSRIWELVRSRKTVILSDELPTKVMQDWLKYKYPNSYIVSKRGGYFRRLGKLSSLKFYSSQFRSNEDSYISILGLKRSQISTWRQAIQEYQEIQKSLVSNFIPISSIIPSQEWLEQRAKNRKVAISQRASKEQIYPWVNYPSYKQGENPCIFKKIDKPPMIKDLHKLPALMIYSTEKKDLYPIYLLDKNKVSKIVPMLVSKTDYDKLEKYEIHNWLSIDKFMKGKTKPFSRYCTAFVISKMIKDHDHFFKNFKYIENLRRDVVATAEELEKYAKKVPSYVDDDFLESMIEICEKYNLWDYSIYGQYLKFKNEILPIFDFLKFLKTGSYNTISPDSIVLSVEVLKGRKFRLDYKNYVSSSTKPVDIVDPDEEELEDEETGEDWNTDEDDEDTDYSVLPEEDEVEDLI